MTGLKRILGAVLFAYAVVYTAQVVFSSLYADALSPSGVWRVLNVCTAVGIVVSLIVSYAHQRSIGGDPPAGRYLAAQAAFYATLVLAIWFFTLWFRLLLLAEGESVGEADNVIWFLVSALNPLVLGTTGAFLWRSARRSPA